jgi:glycosyltransferase involved in cell wall biosynthesis
MSASATVRDVERYHLGVLPHLPRVEPRLRIRVLHAPWQDYYTPLSDVDGLELVEVTPPRSRLPRGLWQLLDGGTRTVDFDLLHLGNVVPVPAGVSAPVVAMVHDLIEFRSRQSYTTIRRWARRRLVRRMARRADALVTVTETTARQLAGLLDLPEGRVVALGTAVDPLPASRPTPVAEREPGIVFIGGVDRHKRLDLALKALADLPELELRIVSAGGPEEDTLRQLASRLGVAPRVSWLGRLSDEEARRVVRGSAALIMPSDDEGFGLPVLEALQVGTPVIISSGLPLAEEWERYGGAVFRAGDAANLTRVLRDFLADTPRRERLGLRSPELAARYTWPPVAARLHEVWARLLAAPVGSGARREPGVLAP